MSVSPETAEVHEIRPGAATGWAHGPTPRWLLRALGPSPAAVVLWRLLADEYADSEGRCAPSRDELAEIVECTPRAITARMSQLVRVGALSKEKRWRLDADGQPVRLPDQLQLWRTEPS
jgi:hypothetical protein